MSKICKYCKKEYFIVSDVPHEMFILGKCYLCYEKWIKKVTEREKKKLSKMNKKERLLLIIEYFDKLSENILEFVKENNDNTEKIMDVMGSLEKLNLNQLRNIFRLELLESKVDTS